MSSPKPLNILIHDEVQLLDFGESRTTGPWVKLRLPSHEHLDALRRLDTFSQHHKRTGHVLNLTLTQGDIIAAAPPPPPKPKGPYGAQATKLKLSQFFFQPQVWQAIGDDESFLAWLRTQPCAFEKARLPDPCGGDVIAAHVRRVNNGAGMGIKPPYSAIPCCDAHHQIQHSKLGEDYFGGPEEFDKLRMKYLANWGWNALRELLGYESMSEVPPETLAAWALENAVYDLLPQEYQ